MGYDAIVIGCGHNGLVAGFYLAQAGVRVLALEQSDKVGGMASTDELIPGFHFNTYGHSFVVFHTKILDDMRLLDGTDPLTSGRHALHVTEIMDVAGKSSELGAFHNTTTSTERRDMRARAHHGMNS